MIKEIHQNRNITTRLIIYTIDFKNWIYANMWGDIWAAGQYSQAGAAHWRTWIDRYTIP